MTSCARALTDVDRSAIAKLHGRRHPLKVRNLR